jgi:hypothetical protein
VRWLFFRNRERIYKHYNTLFNGERVEETGGSTDSESKSFAEHWGWFATIYNLAQSSILNITGDKSITDLNFIFVLNYLAIDQDAKKEEERQLKESRQTRKIL